MTTSTKEKSIKSSFTIKSDLFKRLETSPNKSKVINEALSIYFEKKDYLSKAEDEFWNKKINEGLLDIKSGNIQTINPNGEKITKKSLNKTLWK